MKGKLCSCKAVHHLSDSNNNFLPKSPIFNIITSINLKSALMRVKKSQYKEFAVKYEGTPSMIAPIHYAAVIIV